MAKFLKLLAPAIPGLFPDEQQEIAREQFPQLVAQSRLHYWKSGDAITSEGIRILVGLGASYSLPDLRFADILNEALACVDRPHLRVDVFNVQDDISPSNPIDNYFPGIKITAQNTPFVGLWRDGNLDEIQFGHIAIDLVFRELQLPIRNKDVFAGLIPLDPRLVED